METLTSILHLLRPGMWASSVDLKDAYLHIPIRLEDQRFLAFRYKAIDYRFTALPFGLSTGTQGFHQGNKGGPGSPPPKRGNGVRLPRRLVSTRQLPTRGSRQYKRHRLPPDETGVVNQCREIQPRATQSIIYLGARLDLASGMVYPTAERTASLVATARKILGNRNTPALTWQRLLGKMASFTDLLDLCRLRIGRSSGTSSNTMPGSGRRGNANPTSNGASPVSHVVGRVGQDRGRATFPEPSPYNVDHDGCLPQRWGAVWGTHTVAGEWAEPERGLHINILETEAVLRAVRHWATHLTGHTVTVRSDNTTTVAYINRQGGTRSLASYAGHGTCSSSATPFGSAYGRPT
ncbi:hypothetical protein BSL78_13238 [Apostichopus japonicus]|uniref:Reverse transcriptase domain-containing protein n=1 Tax=Stichopus japonicus TaxID=307972 RepID=A0A2G8KPI3_STIJA|nr:hypothetical protein BSL78_13238 [Apostichopus japonicus]